MATQAIRLWPENLRSLDYTDLSSSYAALGDGFENPVRIFHLQNLTDADIFYSFDGTNDHGVVASGSFILLDVTANKTLDQGEFIAVGTVIYVSTDGTPTSGAVYLSVFYGARS